MGDFTSFLPNFNFYFNSGLTYKFRITKMTRCYITIHSLEESGDTHHQRIKIRKDSKDNDYVLFKHTHSLVKVMSNKVNYTDEV